MFSTTIKRSVATLGVVAGLLAAAVPASAQIGPGTMGVKAPSNDAGRQPGGTEELGLSTQARRSAARACGHDKLRGEAIDIIP